MGYGLYVGVYKSETIYDLEGGSFEVGGSFSLSLSDWKKAIVYGESFPVTWGPSGGPDLSWSIPFKQAVPDGIIINVGKSIGFPVETHAQISTTGVHKINLPTINLLGGSKLIDSLG